MKCNKMNILNKKNLTMKNIWERAQQELVKNVKRYGTYQSLSRPYLKWLEDLNHPYIAKCKQEVIMWKVPSLISNVRKTK